MFRRKDPEAQASLWLPTQELPKTAATSFYQRLDRALAGSGFGDAVRDLCAPYYEMDRSRGGRPGIDPEVYFKMQMVGFFEGIPSERGIAARCADSLSIRQFLHYELHEGTPDHSSLTVIRKRLGPEVYEKVFALVLKALRDHKLLRGRKLGIDASVMEANASLRSLEHRLTGEDYQEYVSALAEAAGVDASDPAAVRRFDRNRKGRKTSNDTWQNPHDPDAKIGRTKRGSTRMVYKPEHVVDLETGAIVDADVRPGHEHDTADLTEKVLEVEARVNEVMEDDKNAERVELVAADKGYFKLDEIYILQGVGIDTAISDPQRKRRMDRLSEEDRVALETAQAVVTSESGRGWMRKRSELVERGFQHVLDCGGTRRTTLRGRANIRKLYLIKAACANLSLLMRQLVGVGTPKQALAGSHGLASALLQAILGIFRLLGTWWTRPVTQLHPLARAAA
jgi:transposase